ncbi:amidase [Jatrophihabitans sp. GAS493]|uniref:amidase n=1 Tax=Jatrophihabitans sp. GAS493 TaxID=1907575 RepID=UPI000BB90329|nr:amidase [Jatrophihabitans sp. GAS493]SOD72595.1 amidase [Jatrophihabitans sp. GAS493]
MTETSPAPDRIATAHRRWQEVRWTNALLATVSEEASLLGGDGELGGLAFTVKDTFATTGLVSTGGSLLLKDHLPTRDTVFVSRLRAAGATLFGKGNCAEFGNGIHTETRVGGRVLHPTDPEVSPGGSSGGDAVAVATGIVDFSIGGDYGGSVRWPAQCVGVYGLRTSAGLVPRTGRMPSGGGTRATPVIGAPAPRGLLSRVEVPGVYATTPAMISRVLKVISGSDGDDWFGLDAPRPPAQRHRRIAITSGRECGPVSEESLDALSAARAAAVAAGYEIIEVEGLLSDAFEIYNALRDDLDVLDDLRALVGTETDLLCPGTRNVLASRPGRGWGSAEVRANWAYSREIVARIRGIFGDVDALLVPVAGVSAVAHDGGVEIDGRWIEGPDLMAQCRAISLTGLPSLTVPTMPTSGGRSVAVQLVGPPGGDQQCCDIATELTAQI